MDSALGISTKPQNQTETEASVSQDVQAENLQVDSLVAIEGLIKNRLQQIEVLSSEMRSLKEMFDDFLINDPKYSEASENAKDAVKAKTAAKKEAVSSPEAESIVAKLKDAREQMKDLKETLSASLRDYEQLSGSNQIEVEPGDIRQIIYNAKLVKARAEYGR